MTTITLSPELRSKITQWKVKSENPNTKPVFYKESRCKTPESAVKRARKAGMLGTIFVSGLLVHAETKIVYISKPCKEN